MANRIDIRKIDQTDMELLRALRHMAPWVIGFVVMPSLIFLFRTMWAGTPGLFLAVVLLACATAGLFILVRKQTRNRSSFGRVFALVYATVPMTYFTMAVLIGVGSIPESPMFILWLIGTLAGCIYWNIHYRRRPGDSLEELVEAAVQPIVNQGRGRHAKALPSVPALPGRSQVVAAEVIRDDRPQTKAAQQAERQAEHEMQARLQMEAIEAQAMAEVARKNARTVVKGYMELVRPGGRFDELCKSRIQVVSSDDYATEAEIRLEGGTTPDALIKEGGRGALASKVRRGKNSIRLSPNKDDYSRLTLRVIWKNPLNGPIQWAGPQAVGQSIGEVPTVFGTHENMKPARLLLPQNHRLRKPNASHVLVEGMNGAGKSTAVQIYIADGSTRPDVVFWAIDTGKGLQTLGPVADALDWFVTEKAKARIIMKVLAEQVIPDRGTLLGRLGYNNWEPECWTKHRIPFLVVVVEEGGVIFEALGKRFVEVMMLARSVGIAIWGSIQRAQSDLIDTNARAQFSEVLTFGVAAIEDAFGMPDEMKDLGADPSLWKNQQPGMAYHYTPMHDLDMHITPLRVHHDANGDPKEFERLLNRVVSAHADGMARLDGWTADSANRGMEEMANAYDDRETGAALVARLRGAGGVLLDERQPHRDTVTITAPASGPSDLVRKDPYQDADPVYEREVVDTFEDDEDDEPTCSAGSGDLFDVDGSGEPVELETLDDIEIEDDPDVPPPVIPDDIKAEIASVGEDPEEDDLDTPLENNFAFLDDDDFEPSDTKKGAEQRLLALLAAHGKGWVFQPADLYDEALPWVDRSKGWIRTAVINWAAAGVLIQRIDDPASANDGKYVTTEALVEAYQPRPGLLPV